MKNVAFLFGIFALAVFAYGNKEKAQNAVVGIQHDGKNFVVGVHFNQERRGIVISDIRGLYPKDNAEWLNWISQGKALYIDKEKIQNLMAQQRRTLAEVSYLDLDSVAKVVRDFENPAIETEENATLSREGDGVQLSRTNARLAMRQAVEAMAARLNLGNVDVVEDGRELTGRRATAKGWYDPRTGRITVVLGNHTGVKDVVETVLHEAVAHYGLRRLVGEVRMDAFLDGVYAAATADVRAHIDALAGKYGGNLRTATEEYLAGLAEREAFEAMRPSLWERVKQLLREMLEKAGLKAVADKLVRMDDGSLRYLLWRSYRNLQEGGRRGVFEQMADAAERVKLGLEGRSARKPADWGRAGALTTMRRVARGEDADLLLRDGEGTARSVYNGMARENATIWREAWQDSMINVRNLQEAVSGRKSVFFARPKAFSFFTSA